MTSNSYITYSENNDMSDCTKSEAFNIKKKYIFYIISTIIISLILVTILIILLIKIYNKNKNLENVINNILFINDDALDKKIKINNIKKCDNNIQNKKLIKDKNIKNDCNNEKYSNSKSNNAISKYNKNNSTNYVYSISTNIGNNIQFLPKSPNVINNIKPSAPEGILILNN
ncbi:hypothetical protein PIROE2DRAFT_16588 [Piromyces sp. E2]|nr:hypothetical protein PIROE2DRAFT_16588 [Piromyces sp. E2]|eukprot:OUM58214.1 hypothetical protein PIROE2DRAFT_16588 [Piromyces sp. E2]